MSRWKPDARGRLEQAAMELYGDRGFDRTTVADIAKQAGLTERTFFRHFSDKREVLFGSSLQDLIVEVLAGTPDSASPIDAVATALDAAATELQGRRPHALRRRAIIAANPELQERELIKLASIASAMAGALRQRGVGDLPASLTAEAGMAVFKTAFEHWIRPDEQRTFPQVIRESFDELKAMTGGS
jgi:AcrR family transcriptional regulator